MKYNGGICISREVIPGANKTFVNGNVRIIFINFACIRIESNNEHELNCPFSLLILSSSSVLIAKAKALNG
jgi:hypothetical protein